jgi:CRISPR-associated endonuclease/helicase Cas3
MALLAKSDGETLLDHTLETVRIAGVLVDSLPVLHFSADTERLKQDALLAAAVHDVGKAATGFQKMLDAAGRGKKANWGGKRHEIISAAFVSSIAKKAPIVFAVLTHHYSIPSDLTTSDRRTLDRLQLPMRQSYTPVWEGMSKEWYDNAVAFKEFWKQICDQIYPPIPRAEYALSPLALSADWLERGYNRVAQRRVETYHERLYASLLRGLTIASDRLSSAHFSPRMGIKFSDYPVLKNDRRGFQDAASRLNGSGILQAPTGSGKTEAALLWAQSNQCANGRMFYVLPTIASINAMHSRLRGVFPRHAVGMLHSRAASALYDMEDSEGTEKQIAKDDSKEGLMKRRERQRRANELRKLARSVHFPIRVCTPHQLLRFSLRGKGWESMLIDFPGGTFVVDEVHAYEPRIVGLLLATLRLVSQWNAKFLIMSATLPSFLRGLIQENLDIQARSMITPDPSNTLDKEILNRKRHRFLGDTPETHGTVLNHIEDVEKMADEGKSALVVCNTVSTAQEVYKRLKRFEERKLIHSRFTKADRQKLEGEIQSDKPTLLVSTQVVEVSLNINYGCGFFEPAPIDALIQRMGRVNRDGSQQKLGDIYVFSEEQSKVSVYRNRNLVKRSMEALIRLPNPLSELDLVRAADDVYEDGYTGEDKTEFEEGLHHECLEKFNEELLAGAHEDWTDQVIEKTSSTIEVLPDCKLTEYKRLMRDGLWIEADSLLVPLAAHVLKRIPVDTDENPWVVRCPYSSVLGLSLPEKNEQEIENVL